MLQNILNLEGVTKLTRKEQVDVSGGNQTCVLTILMNSGVTLQMAFDNYSDGAQGSAQANSDCVTVVTAGNASRCWYDCEYDGPG